jgi:hypothetical protein
MAEFFAEVLPLLFELIFHVMIELPLDILGEIGRRRDW